jgi:hypothetical protein
MKKIIALTIALSAAAGANAYWDPGTDTGLNENGELLFFMFDENAANKISGAQDLGIKYDTMRANATNIGYTVSFALDASVFNQLSSANTVRWGIMGFSQGFFDADYGMMVTSNNADPLWTPGEIDNALANQSIFNGKINVSGDNDYAANNATLGTVGNGRYLGAPGALGRYIKQSQFFDLTAGVTEDLSFWHMYDDFTVTGFETKFAGKWHLDKANNTLTYNLGATPEVPVPAAAWLMGSALVGLAGVARRRNHK